MQSTSQKYKLKLFVAEGEPNSIKAKENLTRICEQYLPGRYETEMIDVLKDFEQALKYNIFITPTLLLTEPLPKVTLLGNLGDTQKILDCLRLNVPDV